MDGSCAVTGGVRLEGLRGGGRANPYEKSKSSEKPKITGTPRRNEAFSISCASKHWWITQKREKTTVLVRIFKNFKNKSQ